MPLIIAYDLSAVSNSASTPGQLMDLVFLLPSNLSAQLTGCEPNFENPRTVTYTPAPPPFPIPALCISR